MRKTVAAIVVTYNRKELLIKCLESIRNQTHKPDAIFIIDNKSNDGTPELLLAKNYISKLPESDSNENQLIKSKVSSLSSPSENIEINYVSKFENDGGAGGFYEGMKRAYDTGYDWLWMMDDDGIADKYQLKELLNAPKKYKYRNALVIDINDNSRLAFGLKGYSKVSEIVEKNFIENETNPFNGTFIHKEIPLKIGLIKKEMFIWGDEVEYTLRIKKNNFQTATICKAIHYHPKSKRNYKKIIPFLKYKIDLYPDDKLHIYYRNQGFINKRYRGMKHETIFFLRHFIFHIFHFNIKQILRLLKYYYLGRSNKF